MFAHLNVNYKRLSRPPLLTLQFGQWMSALTKHYHTRRHQFIADLGCIIRNRVGDPLSELERCHTAVTVTPISIYHYQSFRVNFVGWNRSG